MITLLPIPSPLTSCPAPSCHVLGNPGLWMALLSGRSISISKCQGCEGLDYRNAVMLLHKVSSQILHVKYLIESYFSAPGNRCFSPASHHPSHQHQVPVLDSGPLLCYALSLGVSTDLFLQIATTFSSFKSLFEIWTPWKDSWRLHLESHFLEPAMHWPDILSLCSVVNRGCMINHCVHYVESERSGSEHILKPVHSGSNPVSCICQQVSFLICEMDIAVESHREKD